MAEGHPGERAGVARRVHLVLSTEAVAFVAAAGVHLSLSTQAAHVRAGAAEALIATVLGVGLFAVRARPESPSPTVA
jgi:hypothetical protein